MLDARPRHSRTAFSATGLIVGLLVVAATAVAVVLVVIMSPREPELTLGKDFSYDVSRFRAIDPKLIHYEEAASFPTGLEWARGMALDAAGRVHVAGDQVVRTFAPDGARQGEVQTGKAAHCVAVAADGSLFVGLVDHVAVFTPDGTRRAAWESLGKDAFIKAITIADSNVFVADAGRGEVLRCDLQGKVLGRIGRKDDDRNIPGLHVPSPYCDLAVGPAGLLWVTNTGRLRLEAYTFDGDLEAHWGKASFAIEGFCGCCNPTNFAFLPDGKVVTSEKGLPRVKVYTFEGTLDGVVAGPDQFARHASGLDLAVDAQGRVLVLDAAASTVRIFARKKTQ